MKLGLSSLLCCDTGFQFILNLLCYFISSSDEVIWGRLPQKLHSVQSDGSEDCSICLDGPSCFNLSSLQTDAIYEGFA